MSFTRGGYPLLLATVLLAVITFALALRVRSWPIWLAAFALLILSLVVAWFARSTSLVAAIMSVASVRV